MLILKKHANLIYDTENVDSIIDYHGFDFSVLPLTFAVDIDIYLFLSVHFDKQIKDSRHILKDFPRSHYYLILKQ